MYRPRSLTSGWLLLPSLPILLAPPQALAEPPRCTDTPACRDHLDKGVALNQSRQPERALAELEAAYQLTKDPRVALLMGSTLHDLGHFAEAINKCKEAKRAAPSDTELQTKAQNLIEQALRNLPAPVGPQRPIRIVNDPSFTLQTGPVSLTSTATAINNNIVRIDVGSLLAAARPEPKPLYKRAVLWVPIVGLALAAGAAGLTAALWPRPWQPASGLPSSDFMASTVGGVK